jgi:hypothetical protein
MTNHVLDDCGNRTGDKILPEDFVRRNDKVIDWCRLLRSQKVSEELIDDYADVLDWNCVCKFQNLSEAFIEKHADKINWNKVSENTTFSIPFILTYCNKLNLHWVFIRHQLSENVLRSIIKKVKLNNDLFRTLSQYQSLSEEFMREFQDKLDWNWISCRQIISNDFINEFKHKLNKDHIKRFHGIDI